MQRDNFVLRRSQTLFFNLTLANRWVQKNVLRVSAIKTEDPSQNFCLHTVGLDSSETHEAETAIVWKHVI